MLNESQHTFKKITKLHLEGIICEYSVKCDYKFEEKATNTHLSRQPKYKLKIFILKKKLARCSHSTTHKKERIKQKNKKETQNSKWK